MPSGFLLVSLRFWSISEFWVRGCEHAPVFLLLVAVTTILLSRLHTPLADSF